VLPTEWRACDVRQLDQVGVALCGAETVVNLAAEHRDDVHPLHRYYETNVIGAEHVCTVASEQGVRRIVFTSSAAVYGFQPRVIDENGPFLPFNEYGRTKLQAEQVYQRWASEDSTRTLVIIRPTVVFGEGNRGNVYNLIHQIASGKFWMVGRGDNIKSLAYVGNLIAFIDHSLRLRPGVHIFNYVDGPEMTTREIVDHIHKSLGREVRLLTVPKPIASAGGHLVDWIGRVSGRTFPVSAIRIRKFCEQTQFAGQKMRQTGFIPPYDLAEGLTRMIQFDFPFQSNER
jgi:nucleoside-diphosphate-sugar epimerase